MNRLSFHQRDHAWAQTVSENQRRFYLKGTAYIDNETASPATVATAVFAAQSPDTLTSVLQRMNGFCAWVEETPEGVRAAVDHIRSYPLFYAVRNGDLFLSDDAEWVRQQVGDNEMNAIAREEFLLAGYVTGQETLYPCVKQLQAGEYLHAYFSSEGIRISTGRYYRFWHTEPTTYNETSLRSKLEKVSLNAMHRLIEQAGGRQIVIPLSGGYDSRLIASMLKKLGYKNVLCFTYGVSGNKEAEYSRKVALALGFRWVFVEYSADIWRDAWSSNEAEDYRNMAANHASLPHVQDWLAIKELLKNKFIHHDAIIVPGHSGDFVAGSHIPDFVFSKEKHTQNDLLKELTENHLSNCPKSGMKLESNGVLHSRLLDRISEKFNSSPQSIANLYELWDWQERQAKYIVNSVRVYDQFNLKWWLPFWDIEFVNFWQEVPLALRRNRVWFKDWISSVYIEYSSGGGAAIKLENATDTTMIGRFINWIVRLLPVSMKNSLKILRAKWHPAHFLAFEGLIPEALYAKYISRDFKIIGIYSDLYLNKTWGKTRL